MVEQIRPIITLPINGEWSGGCGAVQRGAQEVVNKPQSSAEPTEPEKARRDAPVKGQTEGAEGQNIRAVGDVGVGCGPRESLQTPGKTTETTSGFTRLKLPNNTGLHISRGLRRTSGPVQAENQRLVFYCLHKPKICDAALGKVNFDFSTCRTEKAVFSHVLFQQYQVF